MKVSKCVGIILAWACLQAVSAQNWPDTMWACRDTIPDSVLFYFKIGLCDTFVINKGCWNNTLNSAGAVTMADTGDKWNGAYINFKYQFNTDSVFLKDEADDTIHRYGPRPGYAGFKIFWDRGQTAFNGTKYDSLCFVHKGPLPGHKVHMVWGQGGECGAPITYEDFGEFKSSATWTKVTVPIPATRGPTSKFPDSPFVKKGMFELRMLIYNDTGSSPTSASGNLKLDEIGFVKARNTAVSYSLRDDKGVNGTRFFVPASSGKVTLTVFSLQGEQLFKGLIDVAGGRRYDVRTFAKRNSNLPVQWIQCVQITGAGVNIAEKVCR